MKQTSTLFYLSHRLLPLLLATIICHSAIRAQSDDIREGDEAFRYGYYKTAVDYYRAAYSKSPQPSTAYKIAESLRLSNNYSEAIPAYLNVLQSPAANSFPHCEYFLAAMYRNNGQADSALYYYSRYLTYAANEELTRRARQESRACQWVLDSVPDSLTFSVSNAGRNINTAASESGAVLMGD